MPKESGRAEVLADLRVTGGTGQVRAIRRAVLEAVGPLGLATRCLEELETAVAEAAANAIEHGNGGDPDLPVEVRVTTDEHDVVVRVVDQRGGGGELLLDATPPDLDAQLRGEQRRRGWGLFLMRSLVDEVRVGRDGTRRSVELLVRRHRTSARRP